MASTLKADTSNTGDDNKWTAPEKYPEDNAVYYWNEPTLKWRLSL